MKYNFNNFNKYNKYYIILLILIIFVCGIIYYLYNKNENFTNINEITNNNIYLYWVGNEYKLIKILRNLIYLHSNNGNSYNVHLINKDNIKKYIKDLPDYFYDLQPAHQADFVRVSVICDYGGIWLDSDTLVMDNLKTLFDIIKNKDGFFILQNNEILFNGVFGSKSNTPLMTEWKKRIIQILNEKKNTIAWAEIGNNLLENIKSSNPDYYNNYQIFNGLDNLYPVNWTNCVEEFINKPFENYKIIEKQYQPLIILVNSVYKELENKSEDDILNGNMPLNYFLNKSYKNKKNKLQHNNNIINEGFNNNNNNNNNNNIKLAIQTVFILKENLPFLREWIIYHLHIGFDKIFLYDNTGSIGIDSSNKSINKYSFNFNNIIKLDDNEVNNEMQNILNDFKDNVIYVKWQPKDSYGNIIYGQTDAIKHYIKQYGYITDYTAYTDTDEFIFSVNNTNIKEYIISLAKDDVKKIVIKQKKFADRFCNKTLINILDMTNTIEDIDTSGWAPKIIIKNESTNIDNISNIHSIETNNGKTFDAPMDTLRFNHYNVNKKQIDWMKGFYNKSSNTDFTYGNDNSILRYSDIIKSKCNNKCSNKNNFINLDEITKEYNNLCSTNW